MFKAVILVCLLLFLGFTVKTDAGEEMAIPFDMIQKLRNQMRNVETIHANYDVSLKKTEGEEFVSQVSFLKDDNKFKVDNSLIVPTGEVRNEVSVFNGKCLKTYKNDTRDVTRQHGVVRNSHYGSWITSNDLFKLAGFNICSHNQDYYIEQFEKGIHRYEYDGTERISDQDCVKIRMISPYKEGQNGYTYFLIANSPETNTLKLMKSYTFINNDPKLMLYEKTFNYDKTLSDEIPFPSEIEYKRYNIAKLGKMELVYSKNIQVKNVEINKKFKQSDFEYVFPRGTFVQDFVAGVNFVVGGKLEDIDDRLRNLVVDSSNNQINKLNSRNINVPQLKNKKPPDDDEKNNIAKQSIGNTKGHDEIAKESDKETVIQQEQNYYWSAFFALIAIAIFGSTFLFFKKR